MNSLLRTTGVGVNISLNNSSSLSFLGVCAPPRRMAGPAPFLAPFPPPGVSSFWETSVAIAPSATQEVLPTPAEVVGVHWVISSDLLPLNDPDTLTLLHRSSSDISFASSSLAPGRCFRTWVLTTCQFFYSSLSFRPITPTSLPLPSIFRKLAGMGLPPTLTHTVLLHRNTRLSLPLWH